MKRTLFALTIAAALSSNKQTTWAQEAEQRAETQKSGDYATTFEASRKEFQAAVSAYNRGNYKWAFKAFISLAEQGDAKSQYNLGMMYTNGWGVPWDLDEAIKWFRMAAKQGLAEAQLKLGQNYRKGIGVQQNYTEAVKWYRLAAEQGNAEAQFYLGLMYKNGSGLIQDSIYAHMWWNLSAMQGYKTAGMYRDRLADQMHPEDIAKAKALMQECFAKEYIDC